MCAMNPSMFKQLRGGFNSEVSDPFGDLARSVRHKQTYSKPENASRPAASVTSS